HQENGDPKAARKAYEGLLEERGEHAEQAKRLAGYFFLRVIADDPMKNAATEIRQAAETWLRDYRASAHTPEGLGVRFELAEAYLQLARRQHRQGTPTSAAQKLYEEAQKLFRGLEETENEYTHRAREQRLNIAVALGEERTRGDIGKLKGFQDCLLRARVEAARLNKTHPAPSRPKQP